MSKTKKKKNKKHSNKKKSALTARNPKSFFKAIGIKPLVNVNEKRKSYHIEEEILKRFGPDTAEAFNAVFNEGNLETAFDFCHKSLDLVKIWCGAEFNRICLIAEKLKQLSIPNIRNVLDIGGGAGQIAFFMAKLWPNFSITVADKFKHIGREWAKEIGEDRVHFIDALLPDLKSLESQRFDLIILCRVIGSMEDLNLPSGSGAKAFDTELYFESQEGKRLFDEIEKIAKAISGHLKDDGRLVVIDSWSALRVLIVGRAFERKGLFIDLKHFLPERVSRNYSTIVFSKSKTSSPIQDIPRGLSIIRNFGNVEQASIFSELAAESLRKVFNDATVIVKSEYINEDDGVAFQDEILEKEGLSLTYCTRDDGGRVAILASSLSIPYNIKFLKGLQNSKSSNDKKSILKKE